MVNDVHARCHRGDMTGCMTFMPDVTGGVSTRVKRTLVVAASLLTKPRLEAGIQHRDYFYIQNFVFQTNSVLKCAFSFFSFLSLSFYLLTK